MKKNTKIIIVVVLFFLTGLALWAASNLKTISDLDIFNIEED
jgi:hypothetical protein